MFTKSLCSLLFLFLTTFAYSADVKVPSSDFANFKDFYVFGPEGSKSFGKDDSKQIIYFSVPDKLSSFELKVAGPGSTTSYERSCIDGKPANSEFAVYGGAGALKADKSGKLLKKQSFTTENGLVTLGSFKVSEGYPEGSNRIFKLHIEAVSGENINFFSLLVNSTGIEVFAYDLSIHAHATKGDTIRFDVDVPAGTSKIKETNYDMAESLKLLFGGKSIKGSLNGQRVHNTITPSEFGRTAYKLVSDSPDFNNVAFAFSDQNGNPLRTYLTPAPKKVVKVMPKSPDFNMCEIDTSLVRLEKKVPTKGSVGEAITFEMVVTAKQAVKDVIISGLKPEKSKIVKSEPAADTSGKDVVWVIPQMAAGETKTLKLTVLPEDEGVIGFCSSIVAVPRVCKNIVVGKAQLTISKTGPTVAKLGSMVDYKITVKNIGNVLAKDVSIVDEIPEGLEHPLKTKSVTLEVGDLKPGESKVSTIKLKAIKRGKHCNVATAKAVNAKAVKDEACTLIVQPGLKVVKTGVERQFVGKRVSYKIVVSNTGDTILRNVVTVDTLPGGLKVLNSGGGVYSNGRITWQTGTLNPGAKKEYTVTVTSMTPGTLCNVATVKDSSGLSDSSKSCTVWKGHPALLLEVIDTVDPLVPGDETTYVIRVTNQGTAEDLKVKIAALFPAEISPMSITGSTKGQINGKNVTVAPFAVLKPKGVLEWRIKAKAVKTGDARLKVQMSSELLKTPVNEEESTHVY